VADGGQYRADIVAAIQTIRRQRDEARAALADADSKRLNISVMVPGETLAAMDLQREPLMAAIRALTAHAPPPPVGNHYADLVTLAAFLAPRLIALRDAAVAYFGGDFTKPAP
jgi:hypothetical protein